MKPILELFAPRTGSAVGCPVAGFGIVCAQPDLIASLRRNPVPAPGNPLAASFLKHSGEQTVAGVAAVYQAVHNHNLAGTDFSRWGVVAAPCFLGRAALAHSLQRFSVEGAWGISPHVIPHHSIHAVSGTVSQALGIQGPNFGIGGGPGGIAEAMIVAATLMAMRDLPGLWVILTELEPEFIPLDPTLPATNGHPPQESTCYALAMALVPQIADAIGITLHICPKGDPGTDAARPDWFSWLPLTNVSTLVSAFLQDGSPAGKWRLGTMGWVELTNGPENEM